MSAENMTNQQPYPYASNDSWAQYQQLRLSRIRQQRQRMQNMKQVIQKYSKIIADLQITNKSLYTQNQQLRLQLQHLQSIIKTQSGPHSNKLTSQLTYQLQKQQNIRKNLQQTIQHLKQDISILNSGRLRNSNMISSIKNTYQIQYETLRQLYQDLKHEVYLLNKENYELKSVIYEQSKYHAANKEMVIIKGQGKDKPQYRKIKNMTQPSIKQSQDSHITVNDIKSAQNIVSDKEKIKQLKNQIKKLYELIEKFKKNQQQQLELIQILKDKKTKVCLCHIYGVKSSNKLINVKEDGKNQKIKNNNKGSN